MVKMKYEIAGEKFASKDAIQEHVRDILHGTPDKSPLHGEQRKFMEELLTWHHSYEQKVGCGVAEIFVQQNEGFPTRCFWIRRTDGTVTDFSFKHCLTPKKPMDNLNSALRAEVLDQILDCKLEFFRKVGPKNCPISGQTITSSNCHVDHADPTFQTIVSMWIASRSINVNEVKICGFGDGEITKSLEDCKQSNDWRCFHLGLANLRVVSRFANLSILKKGKK